MTRKGKRNTNTKGVRKLWTVIEEHLIQHAPLIHKSLNSGATEAQISGFEEVFGAAIPADLRESLHIHDGQSWKVPIPTGKIPRPVWFLGGGHLNSVSEMVAFQSRTYAVLPEVGDAFRGEWPGLKKDSRIRYRDYWCNQWIPLTDSEGDGFCIDMAPAAQGVAGQVFYFCRGDHWPRIDGVRPWQVLAPDFTTWLAVHAELLEEGRYTIQFEGRCIRFEPREVLYERLLAI